MRRIYTDPATGHVFVEDSAGWLVGLTQWRPVNLLPQANWPMLHESVAFPDFSRFVNYAPQRAFNPSNPPLGHSRAREMCAKR